MDREILDSDDLNYGTALRSSCYPETCVHCVLSRVIISHTHAYFDRISLEYEYLHVPRCIGCVMCTVFIVWLGNFYKTREVDDS